MIADQRARSCGNERVTTISLGIFQLGSGVRVIHSSYLLSFIFPCGYLPRGATSSVHSSREESRKEKAASRDVEFEEIGKVKVSGTRTRTENTRPGEY